MWTNTQLPMVEIYPEDVCIPCAYVIDNYSKWAEFVATDGLAVSAHDNWQSFMLNAVTVLGVQVIFALRGEQLGECASSSVLRQRAHSC